MHFISVLNVILLNALMFILNNTKTVIATENENACCKLGQVQGFFTGHCLTLNVTSAVTTGKDKNETSADYFSCLLTAKMCCLQGQQAKLCRRVAQDMLAQEPVDSLLGTAILQNRDRVRIDANGTHLSKLLTSNYACDLKRNTDAMCCLGCNLGLLWAVSRLEKLNGELPIETITNLDTKTWCYPNKSEHSVGETVSQSMGFTECCRESLQAIHKSIRWCELKPAPCSHRCHEAVSDVTGAKVQCSCYEGYRLAEDGKSCLDTDECTELTHNCDRNYEVCHNTEGGFQCVARKSPLSSTLFTQTNQCSAGYYFNTTEERCKDIDECRYSLHDCNLKLQVCRNLLGAYICLDVGKGTCPSGFRLQSDKCVDVDECEEGSFDCDKREICENFIGSYTCEEKLKEKTALSSSTTTLSTLSTSDSADPTNCAKGFHFVRFTYQCEDTNECKIGQHDCNLAKEKCVNFPGTYKCIPLEKETSLIAETRESANQSSRMASLRIQSSNQKVCPSGYERNEELNICEDSDECSSALLSPCSDNAYCQNTIGSFVCHCKNGFIKTSNDSHNCEDINECERNLHNCFGTLKCANTVGSFECLPSQPELITSSSTFVIHSQHGSQVNFNENNCDSGQVYDKFGRRCVGKDEGESEVKDVSSRPPARCESEERIINGECRPVLCSLGFFYNTTEKRCQDVNECLQFSPCSSSEKCTNTIGSYRCSIRCNSGYQKVNFGQSCEDIDECKLGSYKCPSGQVCKNRPGGYSCQCPPGHLGPDLATGQCQDVDECQEGHQNVCQENQVCINTPGSFKCQCKEGFREERQFGSDRFQCIDKDECGISSEYQHRCEHICLNYAGSYKCACKSGFKLAPDGFSCVDINECETLGKAESGQQVNKTEQVCYFKCINQPGSFECVCPPGYESLSDGRICKDIDECENNNVCRGPNEYCLNVHGSYRCNVINCPDEYYLDFRSKKCLRHSPENPSDNYDIKLPLSYSYNYLGIVSNVRIPSSGHLDLLAMSGPVFSITAIKFELNMTSAKPHRSGIPAATREHFLLRRPNYDQIIVSLTKSIEGPQDIELELTVSLYNEALFAGSTKAFINVVVSEYEF